MGVKMDNFEQQTNYKHICELADSMAQAATTFNGHGYWIFLQAREDFQTALHAVLDEPQE
jgi:hypothetical protein